MSNNQARWSVEANVDPRDKTLVRAFVRNEIAYYNALLGSMGSRLRTMPEIFNEVSDTLIIQTAVSGPTSISSNVSERIRLFLEAICGPTSRGLHAATRGAMAVEMLRAHRQQAHGLSKTKGDSLESPVALLSPHDGRVKRHVQLLLPAVAVIDSRTVKIPYARNPITLTGDIPTASWNIMVLRDTDLPGAAPGPWVMEFRNEQTDYLLRMTDPAYKAKRQSERSR